MITDQTKYASTNKLFENDPRITKLGRFIRKTSIDEIPQLINILRGEMSFIGPRPPLTYFPKKYEEYSDFEKQRFLVKPGISGLAQIRCREVHDWNINIPIDVEYVNSISFSLDLKLFLASLLAFFKTDNVYRRDNKSEVK
jgi:undecaprenyl phosphate N,N'-diacetylbacillosamine 1-phosphate transferase